MRTNALTHIIYVFIYIYNIVGLPDEVMPVSNRVLAQAFVAAQPG